jgi:hypothetical protein
MARPKKAEKAAKAKKEDQEKVNYSEKSLFLIHLPIIEEAKTKLEEAKDALKRVFAEAKADGFSKADFTYALNVQSPEKEAETKAAIYRQLQIAEFLGSDLGTQAELFAEPIAEIPSSDRAYDEGRAQALANKPAKPGYDPGTEQYRKYLAGFHSISEERITSGFVPLTAEELENQQTLAKEAQKH